MTPRLAVPTASPRVLAVAAGCLWLWTCGGDDGPVQPEPPRIEELTFAAELGVDLSRMTRLPSGMYIRDLTTGEGVPAQSQTGITFSYQGWLHDGTPVDRGVYPDTPFLPGAYVSPIDGRTYYLLGSGGTIAAWDLGLEGMRVGGRRQLVAPPRLAYGARGSPDGRVPPNAVLVYELDLLSIEP